MISGSVHHFGLENISRKCLNNCRGSDMKCDTCIHGAQKMNPVTWAVSTFWHQQVTDISHSCHQHVKVFTYLVKNLNISKLDWSNIWFQPSWSPDDESYHLWWSPYFACSTTIRLTFVLLNATLENYWEDCHKTYRHFPLRMNCYSQNFHLKPSPGKNVWPSSCKTNDLWLMDSAVLCV